ncbi:hypothetical protein ACFUTY_22435 [Streptomyces sp. NPDC057362]|uniref:hypothetical protein n=1 Tax=Streptomyces sp. NPDC057362 TaxID=3346106 RepID=UPI003642A737
MAQPTQPCYADPEHVPLTCGTYGLSPSELRAEAQRLLFTRGWQLWEVAARLALPRPGRGRS